MPEPMTDERREEIRAALEPLPGYPWEWGGDEASGPILVSNDDYPVPLMSGLKGDPFLFYGYDPGQDYAGLHSPQRLAEKGLPNIIGHWIENSAQYCEELLFESERLARDLEDAVARHERHRIELRDKSNDLLGIRGHLAPADRPGFRAVPFPLGDTVAPAVAWLVARNHELEAENARLRGDTATVPHWALPVTRGRVRELAEHYAQQWGPSIEFQDVTDDLGDREEFRNLDNDDFGNLARAVHDLATKAVHTARLPKEA